MCQNLVSRIAIHLRRATHLAMEPVGSCRLEATPDDFTELRLLVVHALDHGITQLRARTTCPQPHQDSCKAFHHLPNASGHPQIRTWRVGLLLVLIVGKDQKFMHRNMIDDLRGKLPQRKKRPARLWRPGTRQEP